MTSLKKKKLSLMYATVATRPDITSAVSTLSQYLNNPGQVHWEAVKQVFPISLTPELMQGNQRHRLTDTNSDSQGHRHARSDFSFLIDRAVISWAPCKQELVTLSNTEAEYVAATHAAKERICLQRLTQHYSHPHHSFL